MTSTLLITDSHNVPTLTLVCTPKPGLSKIIPRITDIAECYQGHEDYLSKQLQRIIREGMTFLTQPSSLPSHDELMEKLDELRRALTNPLNNAVFQDPWIYEGIVIEKQYLDEIIAAKNTIVIGNIETSPHDFAKEVIGWLDTLTTFISKSETVDTETVVENRIVPRFSPVTHEQAQATIANFQYVKHLTLQLREQQELNNQYQQMITHLDRELDTSHNELTSNFYQTHRRVEETYQNNIEELNKIKNTYSTAETVITDHLKHTKSQLDQTRNEVTTLDAAVKELNVRNRQLNDRIIQLENEAGGGGGCTLL